MCGKLTKKCGSPLGSCCFEHIKETLNYTTKLFDELKINYWLDYNTLRGTIDNTIYSNENAIGIDETHINKIMAYGHRIYEDGYFLSTAQQENWLQISYSRLNLVSIDIIGWDLRRNSVRRKPVYGSGNCNFEKKFLEPMGSILLDGIKVPCPNFPADFVKLRYER